MAVLNWVGGPKASGISTSAAIAPSSTSRLAIWIAVTGPESSSGPATGVPVTRSRPPASDQQASGVCAIRSRTRHRGPIVPVARPTWTLARVVPMTNQIAYGGIHSAGARLTCASPLSSHTSQPADRTSPTVSGIAIARHGRHRRPTATTTSSGSAR